MVPINYLAIVASTVVMMVLGSLWYGPIFGKKWIALMGFDPQKVSNMQAQGMGAMWKSYLLMAIGALVMSYVLAHNLAFGSAYLGISGVSAGLQGAFWQWLGFVVPVSLASVIWDGKPWMLWVINAGYYLVGLLIIGALLSMWV